MPKNIVILGSTGSIGTSALKVVEQFPDEYNVVGLVCNRNIKLLEEQIKKYSPIKAAVADENVANSSIFEEIKQKYPNTVLLKGVSGIQEVIQVENDILLSAIVGAAGLEPSISGMKYTKRIALANKETLVMSGDLFKRELKKTSTELIPVDSEHSAIFSLLDREKKENVSKIIITASGGSLRDKTIEELKFVTPEQALSHPTWSMGSKITIDSATLMNKGLEVIEAHHLFDFDYENIDVVIHPESIIHSLIETVDGSIYAHMGVTDMVFPILNSFSYPEKYRNNFGKLDLSKTGQLTFREYDEIRFPALKLCYYAGKSGGTAPVVLNSANEIAVEAFLNNKIKYCEIYEIIDECLQSHEIINNPELDEIKFQDVKTRQDAEVKIKKRYK